MEKPYDEVNDIRKSVAERRESNARLIFNYTSSIIPVEKPRRD